MKNIHFTGDNADGSSIISNIKMRSFLVNENSTYVGKSVANIEKDFKNKITFEKIFKNGQDTDFDQNTLIN